MHPRKGLQASLEFLWRGAKKLLAISSDPRQPDLKSKVTDRAISLANGVL